MKEPVAGKVISELAAATEISLPPAAERKLSLYIEDIHTLGRRTHLVGRSRIGRNIESQILDSAILLKIFENECSGKARVADLGSGAGFPGIVWSILNPTLEITLIEKKSKLADFLSRERARLDLKNVEICAEDASRAVLEPFEAVVSKAAGRLEGLLPVVERLLDEGGCYITIKGDNWKGKELPDNTGRMELILETPAGMGRGTALLFRKEE